MSTIITAIVKEEYWLLAIPPGLLLIQLLLVNTEYFFLLLAALIPLSVRWHTDHLNLSISIPSEVMAGILSLVVFFFIFLSHRNVNEAFKPTMSKIILLYWLSMATMCVFSELPWVSVKSIIVSGTYIVLFYFFSLHLYKTSLHRAWMPVIFYGVTLLGVALHTMYVHADYGFDKNYSILTTAPFFSDHTIYGACMAFILPFMVGYVVYAKKLQIPFLIKNLILVACLILLAGIYFSFSRATWISLIAAIIMSMILKLRIGFLPLLITLTIFVFSAILLKDFFVPTMARNKNDSKKKRAGIEEQIKSVTSIKNDVSNAERVNRWLCAWRMFTEKPFTGYGPGTYQFTYIPFQKESEMTSISVTSAKPNFKPGMGGTAHSEYLLLLSESGIIAFIFFLSIIIYSLYIGMYTYYKSIHHYHKILSMLTLCAISTYWTHSVFNNFLNVDKAAFLFWSSIAILVTLYEHTKKLKDEKIKTR
ncbi:MAG: O-antigen ligase family protein [Cytophagaceae bacterium]|nr:O-antigen ligase family protein [Cytophagaceae bacterium]MDW8456247.1 O-antigen ligase family protein [Cytophagaceae bacterium]